EYTPMTLVELDGSALRRSEVWPAEEHYGLPVLLAGGEGGILQQWQHAGDHSWWRWSAGVCHPTGRPGDWAAPGQNRRREFWPALRQACKKRPAPHALAGSNGASGGRVNP